MAENNSSNEIVYDVNETSSVRIADDVLASIAALAATEIEGVAGMVGNVTNELIAKLGVKNLSRGVKISVEDDVISISLSLIMKYGYNVPEVSAKVQERVKSMLENMTGLTVKSVKLNIAGIEIEGK